jgi:hypothetical protein
MWRITVIYLDSYSDEDVRILSNDVIMGRRLSRSAGYRVEVDVYVQAVVETTAEKPGT